MSTFDGHIREFPYLQVDYFRGGAAEPARPAPRACLLSHVHSDHLAGLDTHRGPFVSCSAATRALVLRLTRRPGRLAFARGDAEAAARSPYRHLGGLLKALPLDTPVSIETSPGHDVQVTLLDANHCVGAVMFLIEGDGKAVLYTGDVRAEPWWVNSLVRHPALVEYTTAGLRALDCVYLDTSNVADIPLATKAEGLGELLRSVAACPPDAVFYLHAWTYGYEDVWIALAKMLGSRIHVDDYKMSLYSSLAQTTTPASSSPTSDPRAAPPRTHHLAKEAPYFTGFALGNTHQPGILTPTIPFGEEEAVRIHSCELGGAPCAALQKAIDDGRLVWLRPVVGRRPDGENISEAGLEAALEVGGGEGESMPESSRTPQQPPRSSSASTSKEAAFRPPLHIIRTCSISGPSVLENQSSSNHYHQKPRPARTLTTTPSHPPPLHPPAPSSPSTITFPYARHSSLPELRHLISVLRPHDVWPCTADVATWTRQGLSVAALFGDLLLPLDEMDEDAIPAGFDTLIEAWQQQQLWSGEVVGASQAEDSQVSSVAGGMSQLQGEQEEETGDEYGEEAMEARGLDSDPNFRARRAPKRSYSTYAGDAVARREDEGEAGRQGDSQTSTPSTLISETRKRAFRAMESNSGGGADWVSIDLISTTAHHSCLEPELGTS